MFDSVEEMMRLFSISGEFVFILPLIDSKPTIVIVLLFSSVTLVALLKKSVIALHSPPTTTPSNHVVRLSRSSFSRAVILLCSVEVFVVNEPIVVSVAAAVA